MHPRLQAPFALMIVCGSLQILFVLVSLAWFLFGVLAQVVNFIDRPDAEMMAVMMGLMAVQGSTKIPQAAMLVTGAMALRGAWHMHEPGRYAVIRAGYIAAMVGPAIAIVGSICIFLGLDCTGFFCGGFGRVALLALGLVAASTAHSAFQDDEILAPYLEEPGPDPWQD